MAFTTTDLETYESAIRALASGAKLVRIGNREYQKSNLKELRDTYSWMQTLVNGVSENSTIRMTFNSTSNQDEH